MAGGPLDTVWPLNTGSTDWECYLKKYTTQLYVIIDNFIYTILLKNTNFDF